MKNYRKQVILFSIAVGLCTFGIVLINKFAFDSTEQIYESDTPNSYAANEIESDGSEKDEFILQTPNLGSANISTREITFSSLISNSYEKEFNTSHVIYKSADALIYMFLGLGETGGLKNGIAIVIDLLRI